MSNREDMLERALEESKRSLAEVVDEVIHCEKELARYKQACSRLQERVQELESDDNNDHTHAIRSLKQMLIDQQGQFESQKQEWMTQLREAEGRTRSSDKLPKKAEAAIAEERSLREDLERTLQNVVQERDAARNELLAFSMKSNLSLEEKRALEEQRRLMKDEFERSQRNAEGAVREQRASEKRFEALAEEMRQVMEERDVAFSARDEARRLRAEEERKAEEARRLASEAQAVRDALLERVANAERARDAAVAVKQSEERMRMQCESDIEVFRQQAHTLQVERDAALRENESVLERLDQALGARRLAVAARAEALKQVEETQGKCDQADARARLEAKRADEMESKAREATEELNRVNGKLADNTTELRDAHSAVQEYKDLKEEAERECEAARRQVRGLNEEMLSVLKARDLALAQRDEAFARARPALLENRPASSPQPALPSSSSSSSSSSGLMKEAEELRSVVRGVLLSLQQMDESPTKAQPTESPSKLAPAIDLATVIRLTRADATELTVRVGTLRDRMRAAFKAERDASRQLAQVEARLGPMSNELEDLRTRARESEEALRAAASKAASSSSSSQMNASLESLRKELRERIQECESLRDERRALYVEVKELTLQLNRATPQKREVDTLRERLRQVLSDFDRIEAENRRLKGL